MNEFSISKFISDHLGKFGKHPSYELVVSAAVEDKDKIINVLKVDIEILDRAMKLQNLILNGSIESLKSKIKDLEIEIESRRSSYYKLDDINCYLNDKIKIMQEALFKYKGIQVNEQHGGMGILTSTPYADQALAAVDAIIKK